MITIFFIIQKEFLQIFRNRMMIPIIFIIPVVQLVILVHAATFDIKHIKVFVIDHDLSTISRKVITKFDGSAFFTLQGYSLSFDMAEDQLNKDNADLIIIIPDDFEKNLLRNTYQSIPQEKHNIQFIINAINGRAAGLISAYTIELLNELNREIISEYMGHSVFQEEKKIRVEYSYWYNPQLDYKLNMLPGILVILSTIIGMFLTALNLVREKEIGTAEQINVTPIRKYQFIIGKLIPFMLIALIELSIGLTIGKVFFLLPVRGSLLLLFLFSFLYLLTALGIGLFISTFTNTQQQVMFVAFFFILIFVLMSGLFTPLESIPGWAKKINIINPIAYFIKVIRMILLKGSGFREILPEIKAMSLYALTILSLAIWRYRKTS